MIAGYKNFVAEALFTGSAMNVVPPADVFCAVNSVRSDVRSLAILDRAASEMVVTPEPAADWSIAEEYPTTQVSVSADTVRLEVLAVTAEPEASVALCVAASAEEIENSAGCLVNQTLAEEFSISISGLVGNSSDWREPVDPQVGHIATPVGGKSAGRKICIVKQQFNL